MKRERVVFERATVRLVPYAMNSSTSFPAVVELSFIVLVTWKLCVHDHHKAQPLNPQLFFSPAPPIKDARKAQTAILRATPRATVAERRTDATDATDRRLEYTSKFYNRHRLHSARAPRSRRWLLQAMPPPPT